MNEKIASLQFLRFLAAALVVIFHTAHAINRYFPGAVHHKILYIAGFGEVGVHIFFVISGFVMVYTSFRHPQKPFSARSFWIRRIIRIYPIYIVYALFYIAIYDIFGAGKELTLVELVCSLLLLPGFSSLIIGPGWTLAYEVYFYLWFGLVMVVGLLPGLVSLSVIFTAAVAMHFFTSPNGEVLHIVTNPLLMEFLLGGWIGYLFIKGAPLNARHSIALLVTSIVLFAAGLLVGYQRLPSVVMWAVPCSLLVAGFIFLERNHWVPPLIQRLSFLGASSYSLYLLHIVLIDIALVVLIRCLNPPNIIASDPALVTGLTIAITLFCVATSAFAYERIEKKIIGGLHRMQMRRATVPG